MKEGRTAEKASSGNRLSTHAMGPRGPVTIMRAQIKGRHHDGGGRAPTDALNRQPRTLATWRGRRTAGAKYAKHAHAWMPCRHRGATPSWSTQWQRDPVEEELNGKGQ